ncbi:MAG TPA: hypothetical protein PK771_05240 [Spirochaetota bacterium]|nr:hypothetical protein [Spirochaetota bacterium]
MLFKNIYLFLLYHQRKYDTILKLTAFKISKNIDKINTLDLRYQGLSSFYKDNFYHSKMCFEILIEKKTATSLDCDYLAYIYSRQNDREKAIATWCKALEVNKNDTIAKKALEYIRINAKEINFSEDDFFEKLLPKEPFLIPFNFITKLLIVSVVVLTLGFSAFFAYKNYFYRFFKNDLKSITELNNIYLPDYNPNLLEKPKEDGLKYSYSEKEIKEKFEYIKKLILDQKAVQAQININQMRLSNASSPVKGKVTILESFIDEPDYGSFKNEVIFKDFIKEKEIYDNIYIFWNGRVTNKALYKEKITFDFIIGDETTGTIDAIIPVIFNKAIIIENKDKIKLFGKIKLEDKKVIIDGKYLVKENK